VKNYNFLEEYTMSETSSNVLKNIIIVACTLVVTTIAIGSILLACGSVVGDIDRHERDITKLDATVELHGKEIVQGKLNDQAQAALTTNTLNVLTSVNTKLATIIQVQGSQATDIALMKQKLEGNK
jgi:hypothetical protein